MREASPRAISAPGGGRTAGTRRIRWCHGPASRRTPLPHRAATSSASVTPSLVAASRGWTPGSFSLKARQRALRSDVEPAIRAAALSIAVSPRLLHGVRPGWLARRLGRLWLAGTVFASPLGQDRLSLAGEPEAIAVALVLDDRLPGTGENVRALARPLTRRAGSTGADPDAPRGSRSRPSLARSVRPPSSPIGPQFLASRIRQPGPGRAPNAGSRHYTNNATQLQLVVPSLLRRTGRPPGSGMRRAETVRCGRDTLRRFRERLPTGPVESSA